MYRSGAPARSVDRVVGRARWLALPPQGSSLPMPPLLSRSAGQLTLVFVRFLAAVALIYGQRTAHRSADSPHDLFDVAIESFLAAELLPDEPNRRQRSNAAFWRGVRPDRSAGALAWRARTGAALQARLKAARDGGPAILTLQLRATCARHWDGQLWRRSR